MQVKVEKKGIKPTINNSSSSVCFCFFQVDFS